MFTRPDEMAMPNRWGGGSTQGVEPFVPLAWSACTIALVSELQNMIARPADMATPNRRGAGSGCGVRLLCMQRFRLRRMALSVQPVATVEIGRLHVVGNAAAGVGDIGDADHGDDSVKTMLLP